MKYYWYVNLKPGRSIGMFGNINDIYIKRSLSPPPGDYYYITESIDGYVHTIKGKQGEKLSVVNDGGSPTNIQSINTNIIEILKNKFETDRTEMEESESDKIRPTTRNWLPSGTQYPYDDSISLVSLRRKKRINVRMNAKKPKYVRKIKSVRKNKKR